MRSLTMGLMLVVAAAAVSAQSADGRRADDKDARPNISLRANPQMAFTPARVSVRAELKGGADDFEEYYCNSVEWVWGDGTSSESSIDCEPYERGKSEIRRYHSASHTYNIAGRYEVRFRLKKGDKVVGAGTAIVQVRPGIRDMGPYGPYD